MKTIPLLLILGAIAAIGFARDSVEYAKFGTDRLTPKQLAKDNEKALHGDMEAAHRLGRHYWGMGSPDGLRWLRVAAALGSRPAQTDFFTCARGMGGGDLLLTLESKAWLKMACDAGYAQAIFKRDAHLEHGKKSDVDFD